MSVREEDKQRNCPNRGLGIAAAAIGVGIGAALYYFFNKREENPDATGSTSSWTCEETFTAEIQRLSKIREQAFRDRSWALEECSICFEPMQLSQEVMALPCTHRFHQPCILPWLQERQTCPNCRKNA